MNKIKYFLLVSLVIVISYFSFYKHDNKLSQYLLGNNTSNITSTSTVLVKATTSPVIEYPVITKNSGIILGQQGEYKNLSAKNSNIIISFIKNIYKNGNPTKEHLDLTFLKYYDDRIAIIGGYSIKPSVPLYIYNIGNADLLSDTIKNLNLYNGYTENKQYMISAYNDGIVYYKAGNYNLKLLPNSSLKAGETYAKTNEMVNEYDLSISTTTPAILKAGVFSDTEYDGDFHKKLRDVEYVLP